MDKQTQSGGTNGVLIGLVAGGVIGAGLVLAFAPRLRSELLSKHFLAAAPLRQFDYRE